MAEKMASQESRSEMTLISLKSEMKFEREPERYQTATKRRLDSHTINFKIEKYCDKRRTGVGIRRS